MELWERDIAQSFSTEQPLGFYTHLDVSITGNQPYSYFIDGITLHIELRKFSLTSHLNAGETAVKMQLWSKYCSPAH